VSHITYSILVFCVWSVVVQHLDDIHLLRYQFILYPAQKIQNVITCHANSQDKSVTIRNVNVAKYSILTLIFEQVLNMLE